MLISLQGLKRGQADHIVCIDIDLSLELFQEVLTLLWGDAVDLIDHGEHGLGGKCFLYEEDIRIPMIIFDPRMRTTGQGHVRDEMVVVPDLGPTVMDLCGLEVPDSMQGESLRALMEGETVEWREEIFTEQLMDIQNYPRSESVRTGEWKYIRYFGRTEDPQQAHKAFRGTLDNYNDCLSSTLEGERPVYEELFNLGADPGETENLAKDGHYADQLEKMQSRLLELARQAKGGDEAPLTIGFEQGQ